MSVIFDQSARPVIFGECLFDHYPNGNKVLAGAPLAVAWHLQGFGLRPLLITRIGQDVEGELALASMHQWGLDTRAVQIDTELATGNVIVGSENGDNSFDIKPDQAWDHINSNLALEWVKTLPCSLLYTGSLAQRHPVSHKTLQRILLETTLPLFIDINLREPWIEAPIIEQCLEEAHWLKINNEELNKLLQRAGQNVQINIAEAKQLRSQHDIQTLYVTDGERGAIAISELECEEKRISKVIEIEDSVGAGDAFSAVCILGLHKSWNQQQILSRANEFAEKICQLQGATSLKKQDYLELLNKWK